MISSEKRIIFAEKLLTMTNIWNYLCDEITKDKNDNLKEDSFQKRMSLFFQSGLFWSSLTDNLREQYKIDFAHTKGYADIVLLKNGQLEIIIELKKPNHVQDTDNVRQLADYMKITRCKLGIYLGEKMELYFNESNDHDPILAVSLEFVKDNKAGLEILELLKNQDFSSERLIAYCQKQLLLQRAAAHWLSAEGRAELIQYMLEKSGLSAEDRDSLERLISIEITDTALKQKGKASRGGKKDATDHEAKGHNNTLYSFDNEKFISKRSFAFQAIKRIVDTYPHTTFEEIHQLVRAKSFIAKKSDWERMTIDQKGRFCDNDDEILTDGNGEAFLVSDQWTKHKIETQIVPICQHFQWKVYRK